MPDITHSTITDPNIHEPKGINLVSAGRVYVANGASSGDWTSLPEVDVTVYNTPVGAIIPYAGVNAPSLFILCYGQAISRSTYSNLFAVIGTTFGSGDGSTTFNLPDLRGRLPAGKDNMGGTAATRLTSTITGTTLGATGGAEAVTLVADNVPSFSGTTTTDGAHTHSINNGSGIARVGSGNDSIGGSSLLNSYTVTSGAGGAHSHDVTVNSGGGSSHPNVQPTIIANYIIFAGV